MRCLEFLVQRGSDVHAVDNEGKNAVFYACCRKPFTLLSEFDIRAVVQYLIGIGLINACLNSVDLRSTNKKGQTALHLAAKNGYLEIFERLLEKVGVEGVSALTDCGDTFLHLVVHGGATQHIRVQRNARMMTCILDGYYGFSVQQVRGSEELGVSSNTGHMEILRRICASGLVDISTPNRYGKTPLDAARRWTGLFPWDYLQTAMQGEKQRERLRPVILKWIEEADL
ncbi:hypothetical protein AJ80_00915 [Polytolypa hystricis UAMH7299]|uniref:Uncharacterized protein n=1 Tax=Polytolypa hystricis (strain UAMH7299) TaxID=1447883 RepID=A0A2B7Z3P1_POLH7|nr:hypothetical protein AJ80_00915 [Polytolypa hystricis UAMH7299]